MGGGTGSTTTIQATFDVMVMTKSESTVDATKAAMAEMPGSTTKPFTEEELKRAKDDILNSFLFRVRHPGQGAGGAGAAGVLRLPANYLETYEAALEKVTVPDLERAAKKYIHPDKLAVLVVGNGPEIKPGLDTLSLGPIHPVDVTIPQPRQTAEEKTQ